MIRDCTWKLATQLMMLFSLQSNMDGVKESSYRKHARLSDVMKEMEEVYVENCIEALLWLIF